MDLWCVKLSVNTAYILKGSVGEVDWYTCPSSCLCILNAWVWILQYHLRLIFWVLYADRKACNTTLQIVFRLTPHVLTLCRCHNCGSPLQLKRLQLVRELRSPPGRSSDGVSAHSQTPPPAWCRAARPPGTSTWMLPGRRSGAGQQRRRKQSRKVLTDTQQWGEKGGGCEHLVYSKQTTFQHLADFLKH